MHLVPGQAGVPTSIGNTGVFATTNPSLGQRTLVDTMDPATATSIVTTVSMYVATAGTFYVHLGALVGTTYTPRAVHSAGSLAVGLRTFTVSLGVVAGDFIGVTSLDGGRLAYQSGLSGSNTVGSNTVASVPTVGGPMALTTTTTVRLAILGTNP